MVFLKGTQGCRENKIFNYFDVYVLLIRISTIRLLIALVVVKNMIIHQMNVKTVFLNG